MQDSLAPLTLDGHYLLHEMFHVRRAEWKKLLEERRAGVTRAAEALLGKMEKRTGGASCAVAILGQKADLMLIHFRPTLEDLHQTQLDFAGLELSDYLEPAGSYVSVVELGLYEMTLKIFGELEGKGLQPNTPEFDKALGEEMARQRERMKGRLTGAIPPRRYCLLYTSDAADE